MFLAFITEGGQEWKREEISEPLRIIVSMHLGAGDQCVFTVALLRSGTGPAAREAYGCLMFGLLITFPLPASRLRNRSCNRSMGSHQHLRPETNWSSWTYIGAGEQLNLAASKHLLL